MVVEMENQPFEGGKERGIYQKGGEGILRVSYIHRLTAYKTQKELYFPPNIECVQYLLSSSTLVAFSWPAFQQDWLDGWQALEQRHVTWHLGAFHQVLTVLQGSNASALATTLTKVSLSLDCEAILLAKPTFLR